MLARVHSRPLLTTSVFAVSVLSLFSCPFACASNPLGPEVSQDTGDVRVVLAPGDVHRVRGTDLTLTFVRIVADSRCPTGLTCIREGDATLLDRCCLLFVHEHAEANEHKNNGLSVILAGHLNKMATGTHIATTGVIGDLFLAIANDLFGLTMKEFPSANRKLGGVTG